MPPQVFEVVVRGRIGPELAGALEGFVIENGPDGLTRLTGDVPDQPRLLGLLKTLDDLHIEVVSVNPMADSPGGA